MAEYSGNVLAHSIIQGGWFSYVNQIASGKLLCNTGSSMRNSGTAWRGGMGWGRRFKREGTYLYLQLVHFVVWKKTTQYYRTIILQRKTI